MSRALSYSSHALRVLEFDRIRDILSSLASSQEGRQLLTEVVPCSASDAARELLAEAGECMDALRYDDPLPSVDIAELKGIFPFLSIDGYNLGIEAIAAVAGNLEVARAIKRYFESHAGKYPLAAAIAQPLESHDDFIRDVRRMITPDLTIADDATTELRSIKRRLADARDSLRKLVERKLNSLPDEIVSERVVTMRNGRFVIPVRDSMKNRVSGAVQDRSQSGRTLFIEPLESIESNNEVRELELAEQAEIERILLQLSCRVAAMADDIKLNQDILVRLDMIIAKARFGVRIDGVIPLINDTPELLIRKGRHPLLEWKHRKAGEKSAVVPLDFSLSGSTVTVVITGPNAGGKTVALKTVGLLTVMALSGIPVPAAEGTALFAPAGLYADIGDEQSIEDDLSTFSSHIKNIVTIVRESAPGSLVLLDELGGSTNPADGEAIALAVLKKLTGLRAVTLATTHHSGLKVFAHETEGVVNASMEFDREQLRPTFVFRMGMPGSSYAFEIAARLGMPEEVLGDAESFAGGERKSLEGLIAEMEEHVKRADDERMLAESERITTEAVRRDYETRLDEFMQKKQALMQEAVAASQAIVSNANRAIEAAVRGIREKSASRESIIEAKTIVREKTEEIKKSAAKLRKKRPKPSREPAASLEPGMTVWAESIGADAVVEGILDGGRKTRIRVGKSKATFIVQSGDLFKSDAPQKKEEQVVIVNVKTSEVTSYEIDLRGMVFDEARDALDTFLDRLHVSGYERARIIHGKGSGALRKKIGAYLVKHPYVESQRLGEWNEGSFGVTVVTLVVDNK